MAHHHNHHHSSGLHLIGAIACFLSAVGAINWGLAPFGYNLVASLGAYAPSLVNPLYYVIGLAGVISLIFFFVKISSGDCKC